ncbi:MAG TPA: dTMP kinase [Gammaproteobacteria bacterium]
MRGAFITVEGIEGVGKTSSLAVIERCLSAQGRRVVVTREPGGTVLGERIREWVLSCDHESLSAETEALLMFAARAHHLRHVIAPALEAGRWVVCDRFSDATFAYQGGGRGVSAPFLECLRDGVHGAYGGLDPDLTLLLDAPVDVGRARIRDREPDRFEREQTEFFERVRETYLRLAERYPARIRRIDASGTKAHVEQEVAEAVMRFAAEFDRR